MVSDGPGPAGVVGGPARPNGACVAPRRAALTRVKGRATGRAASIA